MYVSVSGVPQFEGEQLQRCLLTADVTDAERIRLFASFVVPLSCISEVAICERLALSAASIAIVSSFTWLACGDLCI